MNDREKKRLEAHLENFDDPARIAQKGRDEFEVDEVLSLIEEDEDEEASTPDAEPPKAEEQG